jgi:hypothetical protein
METTRGSNRRINSLQARERLQRNRSDSRSKRNVTPQDAYLYALRVAYLAYLRSESNMCRQRPSPYSGRRPR